MEFSEEMSRITIVDKYSIIKKNEKKAFVITSAFRAVGCEKADKPVVLESYQTYNNICWKSI